jgi:hypothetical protein
MSKEKRSMDPRDVIQDSIPFGSQETGMRLSKTAQEVRRKSGESESNEGKRHPTIYIVVLEMMRFIFKIEE